MGGAPPPTRLEFVWHRMFFEFAISSPPPRHALTLQEIAAHGLGGVAVGWGEGGRGPQLNLDR